MECHILHWSCFVHYPILHLYLINFLSFLPLFSPALSFIYFFPLFSNVLFNVITSFTPHISSSPRFPFFPFLSLLRFLPSVLLSSSVRFVTPPCPFSSLTDTDFFLLLCVCLHAHVCPDTAVPRPTSAVKHLVNYTAGQREGKSWEGGKDEGEKKKRGRFKQVVNLVSISHWNQCYKCAARTSNEPGS